MATARHGDSGFFHWACVGLLIFFGAVAILSIGAPFFVLGLVAFGYLLGRGPRWPASLGLFTGAGLVGVLVGIIGAVTSPAMWAAVGLALIGLSAGAFWLLRCSPLAR